MPKINLRLSEEEHAELESWAHGSGRSLQREIVYRLFAYGGLPEVDAPADGPAIDFPVPPAKVAVGAKVVTRKSMCDHRVPVGAFCKRCDS